MTFYSINPFNGERVASFEAMDREAIQQTIEQCYSAQQLWRDVSLTKRGRLMCSAQDLLLANKEAYAALLTREMGKPYAEAVAEVEKCAWVCRYYADHAEGFLADQPVATEAHRSFVTFRPLGVVLAVMPWNFPLWQVFRFAAPGLMAGNGALLNNFVSEPAEAVRERIAA